MQNDTEPSPSSRLERINQRLDVTEDEVKMTKTMRQLRSIKAAQIIFDPSVSEKMISTRTAFVDAAPAGFLSNSTVQVAKN